VRALRVYERQKLIKPPRSPNGWRRYGPVELARLNTIVILKALGLTLSQIRAVLAENPPSLLRILDVHAQSWQAKRDMAERALTLVEAARERLRAQETLSLEELCELIKRLEANRSIDMHDAAALTRKLINEMVTPEEERAWTNWWAEHPEDKHQLDAFIRDQQELTQEARQLLEAGADPASPPVQALVKRHNEILLRYNVRERNRRLIAWNPATTQKWIGVGVRLAEARNGERYSDFWAAALRRSRWGQAFRELLLELRETIRAHPDPSSSAFDQPIRQLREICANHALGDLLLLIEFRRFMSAFYGRYLQPEENFQEEWDFIERALRGREGAQKL
jgi:DNA-binding transcriptional MerR regulator